MIRLNSLAAVAFIGISLGMPFSSYAEECGPPEHSLYYARSHEVGNYRGESTSIGVDELYVSKNAEGTGEFCLNTTDTNNHVCGVFGELQKDKTGALVFTDKQQSKCTIKLQPMKNGYRLLPSSGWERDGECQKLHCGMYASVKAGKFKHKKKPVY